MARGTSTSLEKPRLRIGYPSCAAAHWYLPVAHAPQRSGPNQQALAASLLSGKHCAQPYKLHLTSYNTTSMRPKLKHLIIKLYKPRAFWRNGQLQAHGLAYSLHRNTGVGLGSFSALLSNRIKITVLILHDRSVSLPDLLKMNSNPACDMFLQSP